MATREGGKGAAILKGEAGIGGKKWNTWKVIFEVPFPGATEPYEVTVMLTTESDEPTELARQKLAKSTGRKPEELIHKLTTRVARGGKK